MTSNIMLSLNIHKTKKLSSLSAILAVMSLMNLAESIKQQGTNL